jgi:hypothetical protein
MFFSLLMKLLIQKKQKSKLACVFVLAESAMLDKATSARMFFLFL